MSSQPQTLYDVLLAWGTFPDCPPNIRNLSLYHLLRNEAPILDEDYYNHTNVLAHYNLDVNVDTQQISMTPSADYLAKERRIVGRPGKMLRRIYPYFTDSQIEALVDKIKQTFFLDFSQFIAHRTTEGAEMARVYKSPSVSPANLNTTRMCKSINDSCLRHQFGGLPHHPVEAYDSPYKEFELHWLEDTSDPPKIAARCMVHLPSGIHGPIYVPSDEFYKHFATHLDQLGFTPMNFGHYQPDWVGAKLRRIPHPDYDMHFIVPYPDSATPSFVLHDDHISLSADENEETALSDLRSAGGVVQMHPVGTCSHCNTKHRSSRLQEGICDDCYDRLYVYDHVGHAHTLRSEAVRFHYGPGPYDFYLVSLTTARREGFQSNVSGLWIQNRARLDDRAYWEEENEHEPATVTL